MKMELLKKLLFTNNTVAHIKTYNLQMNYRICINKIARYKVNIQKSMIFIYINYKQYMNFF